MAEAADLALAIRRRSGRPRPPTPVARGHLRGGHRACAFSIIVRAPSAPGAHPDPPTGDHGDGPRAAGGGTGRQHRTARSALCHPTLPSRSSAGATAPRACRQMAARRRPGEVSRAPTFRGFVAHPEAAPPSAHPASPSARRRSRRRTTRGGRRNWPTGSGRCEARCGHPIAPGSILRPATAPRACRYMAARRRSGEVAARRRPRMAACSQHGSPSADRHAPIIDASTFRSARIPTRPPAVAAADDVPRRLPRRGRTQAACRRPTDRT
jgi:hypothetical protein